MQQLAGGRFVCGAADGEWAKVEDFSHKGLALDAGLVFNVKNFAISAGINSIAFEWCEFSLGFGVRF